MKLFRQICFLLLASSLVLGQSTPSNNPKSDDNRIADQIKTLQDAISSQQQQIEALRQELAAKKQADATPHLTNAALTTSSATATFQESEKPKDSPLSFRIGAADFTPGGYVDFENVFRTTNTGNVAGTNFWAIPFSNTVAGHLTEFRTIGQYSRFNLKTHAKYGENDITGFIEFDFNGNDAANVFVTSNSHTDRLRHFWLDLKRGNWEFMGGQAWGLLTANRVGVGPNSADVFTTFNEDANHQVGNNFTRAAQFRAAYHFNPSFVWAVAIENPQQFTGQGAEVIFPTAFNAALGTQFDAANNAGTPNVGPDIISKFAYDTDFIGKRHFHFEAGGLFTTVKVADVPTVVGAKFGTHSKVGGGVEAGISIDLAKGAEGRFLRLVGNGLWGPGVGRYLIGTGPQAVVVPVSASGDACTSASGCDVDISMVHAGNGLIGLEFVPHPKNQFGLYGGTAYFQRNAFPDITSPAAVKPIIGFGGIGAANSGIQNRAISEVTLDWINTFWRNPQYGALQLVTQASYVTRSPWFVPAGAPKNAHLTMVYVSLKYVLP
jgi:cell division septum initiation protein DivIVA